MPAQPVRLALSPLLSAANHDMQGQRHVTPLHLATVAERSCWSQAHGAWLTDAHSYLGKDLGLLRVVCCCVVHHRCKFTILPLPTIYPHRSRATRPTVSTVPRVPVSDGAVNTPSASSSAYQHHIEQARDSPYRTMASSGRARPHESVPLGRDESLSIDVLAPAFALPTAHGQGYGLTREEVLKGLANRFVHSTTYLYLYATMAFLSLVTVALSLLSTCPGPTFYALELLVNVALVIEVSIRFVAFGKHFWKSTFNVVDLCLVALCLITLIVLVLGHGCSRYAQRSGRSEELLDNLLLIVRNVVQCTRLLSVVRRSGYNVASRVTAIDLNDAQDYNLDLDFEEEGSLARQRMRDGGDERGNNMGWKPSMHTNESLPQDTIIAVDDESEL